MNQDQSAFIDAEKIELLCESYPFPPVESSDEHGLLAIGGDLSAGRLVAAYAQGIFPWYSHAPILWHSPDPRMILLPGEFRVARSLRKILKKNLFEIRFDNNFAGVVKGCRDLRLKEGTWITNEMVEAYTNLHQQGLAHSIEAYQQGELVGGLYGVSLGSAFFGESMFFTRPNASKVALCVLVDELQKRDFSLIDCQVYTDNMARFGAREVDRTYFQALLRQALKQGTWLKSWADWLPG